MKGALCPLPPVLKIMTTEKLPKENQSILGKGTSIQLWMAVVISIFVGGWVVKDQTWKTRVDMRLIAIEGKVNSSVTDNWTKIEMKLWSNQVTTLNADLKLPIIE